MNTGRDFGREILHGNNHNDGSRAASKAATRTGVHEFPQPLRRGHRARVFHDFVNKTVASVVDFAPALLPTRRVAAPPARAPESTHETPWQCR